MPEIRILPEDVARQIAAGEVVERPASVVKELLENALDAGADTVSIRVAGAGVTLIDVRDNGSGMSQEDTRLATRSFSTSKIQTANDLFRVETYGFRGEALASISAVSRLDVLSSVGGGEGWHYALEGKTVLHDEPAAQEKGTTVRVQNLFFNTPARKKFLKSDVTERRRILETVLAFALIFPQLEIHYHDESRSELDLVPTDSWRNRVAAILGASTMKHMVDLTDSPTSSVRVRGFVSLPTYTRANRNQQFLYVNNRLVKEKTMLQALQQAYRSVIPYKRFPAAVIALDVPADLVDVNVHPNKLEVRLTNGRQVFDVVHRAVKQALSGHSESALEVNYPRTSAGPIDRPRPELAPAPTGAPGLAMIGEPSNTADRASEFRSRAKKAYETYVQGSARIREFNPQLSLKTASRTQEDMDAEEPVESIKEKLHGEESLFWQFNNAYIFIQVRGGIVVIDQHAAHERVIFDSSKAQLEKDIPVTQQMLFPITLELSIAELDVLRSSTDVFTRLGFQLEPFGGTSILVRGYPQGLKNWSEGRLLHEIFDDIIHERVAGDSHADRIIASFACRSAVKAGQKLDVAEMRSLADQLFATPNPYSCPHGRPTIQRITLEEVESWFLRR